MVVTLRPSAWTAKSEHDFTATPSRCTVHAPHWLVSQPACVPGSPSVSRRKGTRSRRDSTSRVSAVPLTVTVTEGMSPLSPRGGAQERGVGRLTLGRRVVITRRAMARRPTSVVLPGATGYRKGSALTGLQGHALVEKGRNAF